MIKDIADRIYLVLFAVFILNIIFGGNGADRSSNYYIVDGIAYEMTPR